MVISAVLPDYIALAERAFHTTIYYLESACFYKLALKIRCSNFLDHTLASLRRRFL